MLLTLKIRDARISLMIKFNNNEGTTMTIKMTAKDLVKRAMISMLRTAPYFYSIASKRAHIETTDVKTMSTNGKVIKFNPDFVLSIPESTVGWVERHEVLHITNKHTMRRANRNPMLWNVACDLSINHIIRNEDGVDLDKFLFAGRGEFVEYPEGKSAEWYFDEIVKRNQDQDDEPSDSDDTDEQDQDDASDDGEGSESEDGDDESAEDGSGDESDSEGSEDGDQGEGEGDDASDDADGADGSESGEESSDGESDSRASSQASGTTPEEEAAERMAETLKDSIVGEVEDIPLEDGETIEELTQEWKEDVAAAVMESERHGDCPAWIKELGHTVLSAPRINWKRELRQFAVQTIRNGYSWKRPHRRSTTRSKVILPSRRSKGVGHIMFVIDTSCSMRREQMDRSITEINGIVKSFPNCKVTIMQCDTRITYNETFKSTDLPMKPKTADGWTWSGRGGTSFIPPFEELKKDRKLSDVQCVIYLTDGMGPFPKKSARPTLWLIDNDFREVEVPFGKALKMDTKK